MSEPIYSIPGVYFETPRSRDLRLKGVPVGITGFMGYCRPRASRRGSNEVRWPVAIETVEQIQELLDAPAWSNMLYALYGFFANGGQRCYVVGLPENEPHSPVSLLGGGEPGNRYGLSALDATDEVEILALPDLYIVPPGHRPAQLEEVLSVQYALLDFCKGMRNEGRISQGGYLAIIDAPPELSESEAVEFARLLRAHPYADHAALYYPWIDVMRTDGILQRIPPCGQLAGHYSFLSRPPDGEPPGSIGYNQGPQMSAGNRIIVDAIGAEIELKRMATRDQMEMGVNCLLSWPTRGIVVWGTRTLSSEKELNQISVRRILSYIERSIYVGTQWAVFEPNDHTLWKRLKSRIEIFLEDLWKKGLLVGDTQDEAFHVKCDDELNTASERDEGRVNILVLVRPVRSTEFIVLQISHEGGAPSGS